MHLNILVSTVGDMSYLPLKLLKLYFYRWTNLICRWLLAVFVTSMIVGASVSYGHISSFNLCRTQHKYRFTNNPQTSYKYYSACEVVHLHILVFDKVMTDELSALGFKSFLVFFQLVSHPTQIPFHQQSSNFIQILFSMWSCAPLYFGFRQSQYWWVICPWI